MRKAIICVSFMMLAPFCSSQSESTKLDKTLLVADAGTKLADYLSTMHRFEMAKRPNTTPFIEHSIVARPFMRNHGTAAAYFAGSFALDVFASYELRKHGHRKLARAVLLIGIAQNGSGAIYSAWRHK